MPRRATKNSAGYDFYSPVDMSCAPVNLGVAGYYKIANTVGVIDADYRDTIKLSFTVTHNILPIKRGDRIMQGVIVKFGRIPGEIVPTDERNGGIGSTGV